MVTVNLHELKAHLAAYARRVKGGETVVVWERNPPIGEFGLLPATMTKERRPEAGLFRGKFPVTDDFFAEDMELAEDFHGGEEGR